MLAGNKALAWQGPVLIIDRKLGLARDLGWPIADRRHRVQDVMRGLPGGVCYVPHWEVKVARAEVDLLIQQAFSRAPWDPALLVVVDEAWRVAYEGGPPGQVHRLAWEGRAAGIQGLIISQRPADVSKDVVTQCARQYIFATSMEGPYFQRYGIDHAAVEALLQQGGQYSYVVYESGVIQGPRKERPLTS